MSASLKDRVLADYANMIDSFTNLVKSAKVMEEYADVARTQVPSLIAGLQCCPAKGLGGRSHASRKGHIHESPPSPVPSAAALLSPPGCPGP